MCRPGTVDVCCRANGVVGIGKLAESRRCAAAGMQQQRPRRVGGSVSEVEWASSQCESEGTSDEDDDDASTSRLGSTTTDHTQSQLDVSYSQRQRRHRHRRRRRPVPAAVSNTSRYHLYRLSLSVSQ